MVLLFHGMHKPAGIQFTWPNVLNCEGVYGQEINKFYEADLAENNTIIPFARMLSGALDYTPTTMKNSTKGNHKVNYLFPSSQGTRCHQLALLTLFEAPIAVWCDNPMSYRLYPECLEYMKTIPTTWDETVGVSGKIGQHVVVARRKGSDWFMAAVGSWTPQSQVVPLDFLGEGQGDGKWQLEFFRDGVNAHRDSKDYKKCSVVVTSKDRLRLNFAPGGGWTGRFTQVMDKATPAPKAIAGDHSLVDLNFSSYYAQWREPNRNEPPVTKKDGTVVMPAVGVLRIPVSAQDAKARFQGNLSLESETVSSATESNATLQVQVIGDGKVLWDSPVLKAGASSIDCSIDLSGVKLAEIFFDRNPPLSEPEKGRRARDARREGRDGMRVVWKNAGWTVEER